MGFCALIHIFARRILAIYDEAIPTFSEITSGKNKSILTTTLFTLR